MKLSPQEIRECLRLLLEYAARQGLSGIDASQADLSGICRKVSRSLVFGLLFVFAASCWAEKPPVANPNTVLVNSPLDRVRAMLPRQVTQCLEELPEDVDLDTRINPFYLRGDFDGDAHSDYAFLIQRGGSDGLVFCFSRTLQPKWLGAGEEFHGLTDLDFDDWSVFPKGPVLPGVEESDPPILQSDALFLLWSESASALVYWTGRGFGWYQQGD